MSAGSFFVTGAGGFLGGALARRLLETGANVRALIRRPETARALATEFPDRLTLVLGDLRDADAVRSAADGTEVAVHVAAQYRNEGRSDDEFFQTNVEGTRNVFEAARQAGLRRVVHVSTAGVHGNVEGIADEDAPLAPRDAYQQSKVEGEAVAREAEDLDVVIVRPVGLYGPGDTRFLKLFRAIDRGRFAMVGAGTHSYHMTFVDDAALALVACAVDPNAIGQTFLIAGPQATTLNELCAGVAQALGRPAPRRHVPLWPLQVAAPVVQGLCRAVGVEPPLHPRRLEFFTDSRAFTWERAQREIGWSPEVPLDQGLARTASWYRREGWL